MSDKQQLHGILNVNKPQGITSMDVVRRIKRASRQKRVGHAGTLDPIATGVIPVCLGQATRMMEYLVEGMKEYRGEVMFGAETDTYDAMGEIVAEKDASALTKGIVEDALQSFIGVTDQVPPMYSALKKQGKRLYELARAGIEVERDPRKVEILEAELEIWEPPVATIRIRCGRGLYMRSLAFDLGAKLGVGGHLKSLVRLQGGSFRIEDAHTLDDIDKAFANDTWPGLLHAPDSALVNWKAIVLNRKLEEWVKQGQPIPSGVHILPSQHGERARIYSSEGCFVATATFDAHLRQWQPTKVFDFKHIDSSFDTR